MNAALSVCLALAGSLAATPPQWTMAEISYLSDYRNGDDTLIGLTTLKDPKLRAFAVLTLGQNEVAETFDAIAKVLTADISPNVRRMAAFALGQLNSPRSEGTLLNRLKDEKHPMVRHEIWKALGRCGAGDALAAALGAIESEKAVAITNAGLMLRRLKQRPSGHKAFARALEHRDPQVRTAALYAYFRAPDGALPLAVRKQAIKSLNSNDAAERESAARVLSRGVNGVEPGLSEALQANSLLPHQEAAVVRGLSKTKGQAANALIVGVLHRVLAKIAGSKRIVHPKYLIALEAARALRGRTLTAHQKDQVKALLALAGAHEKADPVWVQRRRKKLLCALWQVLNQSNQCSDLSIAAHSQDESVLTRLAGHNNAAVRMAALRSLATQKMGASLLTKALQDKDLAVVGTAASGLSSGKIKVARKAWLNAWDRAHSASDLEVAGDILRAMLALKIEGAKRTFQAALNSGQIALARLGAKGLKEITGKEVAIPRQSLPKNAAPNLSKYVPLSQGLVAHIKTEVGTIVIRLHSQLAPRTVRNFVDLAKKGYFNGISFHRVVANFVIQGGDPRGDGWGGPGYSIRCENNPLPYRSGTVGMALAGKDTGGSQWFITHSPQPHLLGTYTVFGQVMSGQKVVDTVVEGDKILSVTVK